MEEINLPSNSIQGYTGLAREDLNAAMINREMWHSVVREVSSEAKGRER